MFGLLVTSYVITVIGIPVYLHYCGGELEAINYVMKADSCCGGEEQESENNDCCKDEGLILKSNADFTLKQLNEYDFVKSFYTLLYVSLPYDLIRTELTIPLYTSQNFPPGIQQEIVTISVLRI